MLNLSYIYKTFTSLAYRCANTIRSTANTMNFCLLKNFFTPTEGTLQSLISESLSDYKIEICDIILAALSWQSSKGLEGEQG